jgi:hypothetical protein
MLKLEKLRLTDRLIAQQKDFKKIEKIDRQAYI